jgi:hypothetical protein
MIKVRATPVLKALGFRYNKAFELYLRNMTHGARVYKTSDTIRALEIWHDLYDGRGDFAGRTLLYKNLPLDASDDMVDFYRQVFSHLAEEFEAPRLIEKILYYLGKEEELENSVPMTSHT